MLRLVTYLLLCSCFFGFSQNKQLVYGLQEVPQSLLVNPGGIALDGFYVGVPFLSQLYLSAGSSGVSAYDIFGNHSSTINERITASILKLDRTDFFTINQQLELIGFGWRSKNDIYYSGGFYQEFDMITYFPKDLARLAWEGNQSNIGYPFNFADLSTTGEFLTVLHFGANKRVTERLTIGGRLKLYNSMLHFKSLNNSGTFRTEIGGVNSDNIYQHFFQNIDLQLQTSGYASLRDENESNGSGQIVSSLLGKSLLGGNLGVGFDVGATYEINEKWTVSGSILDIGAVFHQKDVEHYNIQGNYTFEGLGFVFPGLGNDDSIDYYQNLEDEFEDEFPVDTTYTSYTQWRPTKINLGVTYHISNDGAGTCDCRKPNRRGDAQSVGLQLFSIYRPKTPQYAATVFYYRKLFENFAGKVTYTVDPFSSSNIGLALVLDVGAFNFYLSADNLLSYSNLAKANLVSLQTGVNLKFDME